MISIKIVTSFDFDQARVGAVKRSLRRQAECEARGINNILTQFSRQASIFDDYSNSYIQYYA